MGSDEQKHVGHCCIILECHVRLRKSIVFRYRVSVSIVTSSPLCVLSIESAKLINLQTHLSYKMMADRAMGARMRMRQEKHLNPSL